MGETHLEAGRSLWGLCRKLCLVGRLVPLHPPAQAHLLLPRRPARLTEIFRINGGLTCSLLSITCLHTHTGCVVLCEHTDCCPHSSSLCFPNETSRINHINTSHRKEVAQPNDMDLANCELGFNGDIHIPMVFMND